MTNVRYFILVASVLLEEISLIFLHTNCVFNTKVKGNISISRQSYSLILTVYVYRMKSEIILIYSAFN